MVGLIEIEQVNRFVLETQKISCWLEMHYILLLISDRLAVAENALDKAWICCETPQISLLLYNKLITATMVNVVPYIHRLAREASRCSQKQSCRYHLVYFVCFANCSFRFETRKDRSIYTLYNVAFSSSVNTIV